MLHQWQVIHLNTFLSKRAIHYFTATFISVLFIGMLLRWYWPSVETVHSYVMRNGSCRITILNKKESTNLVSCLIWKEVVECWLLTSGGQLHVHVGSVSELVRSVFSGLLVPILQQNNFADIKYPGTKFNCKHLCNDKWFIIPEYFFGSGTFQRNSLYFSNITVKKVNTCTCMFMYMCVDVHVCWWQNCSHLQVLWRVCNVNLAGAHYLHVHVHV